MTTPRLEYGSPARGRGLSAAAGHTPTGRAVLRATWIQHRRGLSWLAVVVVGLAVAAAVGQAQVHPAYASWVDHHCPSSWTCGNVSNYFADNGVLFTAVSLAVRAVPVVIGVFLGAPLLAREFESGTFRFTFTQRIPARSQLAVTLAGLSVVTVGVCLVLGLLIGWFAHPFLVTSEASRWHAGMFETTPLVLAAWGVAGLLAGVAAGSIIRRQVPALATTAALLGGAWLASYAYLVPRLLAVDPLGKRDAVPFFYGNGPLGMPASPGIGPAGSWLVSGAFTGPGGHPISNEGLARLLGRSSVKPARVLASHHISYTLAYQPAGRFWVFQGLEAAALLVVAASLMAGITWRVRRIG